MSRFSEVVRNYLITAGWYEGREVFNKVKIPEGFKLFPAAIKVLREFGNLHIGECGKGKDCAKSDVRVDPSWEEGLELLLEPYSVEFGFKLLLIGRFHHEHSHLVLDEFGRVYALDDEFDPLATSFDQALEVLLLGIDFTRAARRPFEIKKN